MRSLIVVATLCTAVLVPLTTLGPISRTNHGSPRPAQATTDQRPMASLVPDLGVLPLGDDDTAPTALASKPASAEPAPDTSARIVSRRPDRQKRTADASPAPVAVAESAATSSTVDCIDGVCRIVPGASKSSPARVAASAASTLTWHAAREELSRAGVIQFRLETWSAGREYRFSCSVPSGDNPYVSREFEARADSDMGAVAAVLEQIRQWQPLRAAAN